jgi:hypothetical protein
MIMEDTLTGHIIQLREKVARMESDVAHLAHDQDVHSGSLVRTGLQLAHIAQSLRDAHNLIQRIQTDVEALGERPTREPLTQRIREWAPFLMPATMGVLVLLLTMLGKSELAAKLATFK